MAYVPLSSYHHHTFMYIILFKHNAYIIYSTFIVVRRFYGSKKSDVIKRLLAFALLFFSDSLSFASLRSNIEILCLRRMAATATAAATLWAELPSWKANWHNRAFHRMPNESFCKRGKNPNAYTKVCVFLPFVCNLMHISISSLGYRFWMASLVATTIPNEYVFVYIFLSNTLCCKYTFG